MTTKFLDEIKQRIEINQKEWWLSGLNVTQNLGRGDEQEIRLAFSKNKNTKVNGEHIPVVRKSELDQARKDIETLVQLVEMLEDECKYLWNTTETYIQPQLDAYLSAANYLRQKREALALGEKIKENK